MFQMKLLGLTAAAALTFAGAASAQESEMDRGVENVDVDIESTPGDLDVDVSTEKPETVKALEADIDTDDDVSILIGEDADNIVTGVGTMLQVGGGVQNFTRAARETTNPGGYWDVRGVLGTRSIIGAEAAYHGSAQDIDAVGLDEGAWLMSNGLEGALRLQAPIPAGDSALIQPYAFGGVGAQFYQLVNEGTNTSSVEDGDVVMDVPVGVGLAAGIGGATLDGRFTYRHTMGNELLGDDLYGTSDRALNNWSLGANLGFEF
jgi:hypothetical protein